MLRKLFPLLLTIMLLLAGSYAEQDASTFTMDPDDYYTDTDDGFLTLIDRINGSDSTWEIDPAKPWLHVWFPKIHDCDGAIIRSGSDVVILDCCDSTQVGRMIDILKALGVSEVIRVINSHPHHDHIDGLAQLAEVVKIKQLDICFNENYNERMVSLMEVANQYGIPVRHYDDEDSIMIGSAKLTAYLKGDADWNCNELSAVHRLELEQRSMLFMADVTERTTMRLAAQPDTAPYDADIIKYPHHGVNLLTRDFLAVSHPLLAIITNTDRVSDAIKQCLLNGMNVVLTAQTAVHCVTDGEVWIVEPFEP